MDPITHGFLGANFRNLGPGRRWALYVLVVSAMFPDIDYLAWLGGAESFMRFHRGVTHGVFAMVLVPGLIAALASYKDRKKGFVYYYLLGVVGYASHIAIDLTNAYGVRVLAPLDWRSYSLDLIFVIDPVISGAFFGAVLWAAFNKKRPAMVAALALALVVSYIGLRYYFHERTEAFVKEKMSEYRIHRVIPQPGDVMGWWFVASGRDDIKVGYADLYTRHVSVHWTFPAQSMDPVIEATRGLDVVKTFLGFSLTPYAEIQRTPEGTTVLWRELAYTFMPGRHFMARVKLDRQGRVLTKEIIF